MVQTLALIVAGIGVTLDAIKQIDKIRQRRNTKKPPTIQQLGTYTGLRDRR